MLLLIALFLPLKLYAGGQKEDKMPQARELIDQKQYNEAILILTEIMKTDPDQFTEAQKLIQQIRIAREKYNDLYNQLITVLDPPPGESIDENKAYGIIREMEALDSNPNKAAVAAFAQARKSIVFAVENRAYTNIMNTAADLIQKKEYPEAIKEYLGGFELHRDLFVEKAYGNIVEDEVASYQDTILGAARDFLKLYDKVLNASKVYSEIIKSGNISNIEFGYKNYSSVMLEAGSLWRILKANAFKLDNLRATVQREDESDIPYISVKRVLTVGRANLDNQEGIAGVLSIVWDENQDVISTQLISLMKDQFRTAVDNYSSLSFSQSRNDLSNTDRLSRVVVDVLKLRGDKLYVGNNLAIKDNGMLHINKEFPAFLLAQILAEAVPVYANMSTHTEELDGLSRTIEGAINVDTLNQAISTLNNINVAIKNDRSSMVVSSGKGALPSSPGIDLTDVSEVLRELQDNESVLDNSIFTIRVSAEERRLSLKFIPQQAVIDNSSPTIKTASDNIDGVEQTINGISLKVKRPDIATQLLVQTQSELKGADLALSRIIESMNNQSEAIKSSTSILAQLDLASTLKKSILEKTQEIDQLLSKAKVLNDEADNAYSLGKLRLDEAYSRFDRNNFEGARDKYYEAESQFLKSLEFREDKDVRTLLTVNMAKLDKDITLSLNRQIIKEVRTLINKGKDFYNIQEFIKAEQSFQQARERYKVTNEDSNPEIESWLIKISKALEATSGREIALTDPLYSDIISILNLAEEEFGKGKTLLKTGNKAAADALFTDALKNIELVKAPFPRNFKASVMYLQILEYTQPDAFKNFFKSMYDSAVKKIDDDPKKADDDILALYEINPNYPGIKTAVYRSGVAAGRIIPPPAQVDIKKARQLYNQAKVIVDADRRSQFPIALAYLEEAIQIDSNYNAAAVLMDKIRTSSGGISQVAMSTSDAQQLRYAESLYIEGRFLEANIIINQLWNNPDNRKSSKLNDLRTKVESRL